MEPKSSVNDTDTETRTIFGFTTRNKPIAWLLHVVYVFVFLAAWFFAYAGLEVILSDWGGIMRAIVATAIVGLALGIKLALFGRKHFGVVALFICMLAALAPLAFDFFGLYAHTGVVTILSDEKATSGQIARDYNVVVRREAAKVRGDVEKKLLDDKRAIDAALAEQIALIDKRVASARLLVKDEEAGVPREDTTGNVGRGDMTLVRESEARRAEEQGRIDRTKAESEATAQKALLDQAAQARLEHLATAEALLDNLVGSESVANAERTVTRESEAQQTSVIEEVMNAETFASLEKAARRGNALMGQVNSEFVAASERSLDPKDMVISGGNLFDLSIRGIMAYDIAAIVSLFLAFIFEWMDILVVFAIRKVQEQDVAGEVAAIPLNGGGRAIIPIPHVEPQPSSEPPAIVVRSADKPPAES